MGSTAERRSIVALSGYLHAHFNTNPLIHPKWLSTKQGGGPGGRRSMPVVVGGMLLDVLATPCTTPNPRSTTPGKVDFMLGGVARNVAECMAKLGSKPYMISAVGHDMAGDLLLARWRSAGLPTEGIQQGGHIKTATVCCMFDVNGELASGVASVESIEKFLTPEWIERSRSMFSSAPMLMVDANLSPSALQASCQMAAESNVPVWFEPVSIAKSKRIASIAKYVKLVSPNEHELIAMADALSHDSPFAPIENNPSILKSSPESLFHILKPAIWVLIEKGIKFVLVTLGPSGALLCCRDQQTEELFSTSFHSTEEEFYNTVSRRCPSNLHYSECSLQKGSSDLFAIHFPALPSSVVRVSGAGDCMVGAMISSMCSGLNVLQSVAVGTAAAKAALETETNVPVEYNLGSIADNASLVYSAAKVISCESKL